MAMPRWFLCLGGLILVTASASNNDQKGLREQLSELQQEDETNEKLIETLLAKEHTAETVTQTLRKELAEARGAKTKDTADESALRTQLNIVKTAQSTALAQIQTVSAQLDEERGHSKQLESAAATQARNVRQLQVQFADERGRAEGLEAAAASKASEARNLRKEVDTERRRVLAEAAGRASAQRAHEAWEVRGLQAALAQERGRRERVEDAEANNAAEFRRLQASLAEESRHEKLLETASLSQFAQVRRLNTSLAEEASQRHDLKRSAKAQAAELRKLKAKLEKDRRVSQLQERASASAGGAAEGRREEQLENTSVEQEAEIERLKSSLQRAKQALWRTLDDDGTSNGEKDSQTAQGLKQQLQAAEAAGRSEHQALQEVRAKNAALTSEAKSEADSKRALEKSFLLVRGDLLRAASDAAAAGVGPAPSAAAAKPSLVALAGKGTVEDRLAASQRSLRALRDENFRLKAGGHQLMQRYDMLLKSLSERRQHGGAVARQPPAATATRRAAAKVGGVRAANR